MYFPVDVPTILDICLAFSTFTGTFNADWRLNPTGGISNITKQPHPHISTIDLHGLSYAFGILVGTPAGAVAREDWSFTPGADTNDLNKAALIKAHFPKLQRIRALSQSISINPTDLLARVADMTDEIDGRRPV